MQRSTPPSSVQAGQREEPAPHRAEPARTIESAQSDLFTSLLEAVGDAVFVLDADARVQRCNVRAREMFEAGRTELENLPFVDLFMPADRTALLQRLREFAETERPATARTIACSARTRRQNELATTVTLQSADDGSHTVTLACLRPAQETREPRTLPVDPSRVHRAFAWMQRNSAVLDRSGKIVAVDEAWGRLEPTAADHAIFWADVGQNFCEVGIRGSDVAATIVRQGIEDVLARKRDEFEYVYRCHSPTHLRWFRIRACPVPEQPGTVLIDQLDVTDLQLANARLNIQGTVTRAFNRRLPVLGACRELALALCHELDWDFAGIWTFDDARQTLRCTDAWVRSSLPLEDFERASRHAELAPGIGVPGRVWQSSCAQWITAEDMDHSRERTDGSAATIMPPSAYVAGFRTALCFPLKCGSEMIAVVEVFSRVHRPEDRALMELLDVSGEQLALWELRQRAEHSMLMAQREADAAHAQLQSVLDCTPAFITAIDRQGRIMFVNRTIPPERRAEAIGAPWTQFIMPEHQAQVQAALDGVFTTGSSTSYEAKVALPDNRWAWFANYMGPMRSGDATVGAVIISQDITEAKRQIQELWAAQRLAAVGTLAAGVAHEINTPIQFVNDSVHFLRDATREVFAVIDQLQAYHLLREQNANQEELARAQLALSEAEQVADLEYVRARVPKAFDRCVDGLDRVATIVRSMKEFAHPATSEMMPVDLNRAIVATLTIARNEYKYVADVHTELGELPLVTCHANDINQVVLNIVVNAAHAIADRGGSERGAITVRTSHQDGWVTIAISDTGGGIPEAIRSHIFDPFFTTKEVGRGTGQGLAIAWTAVTEKHAGELTFDTVVGQGTTFYVRLPVKKRSSAAA